MKVPGATGGAPPQEMPSEANLLMALAEMHKQGRFEPQQQPDMSNVVKLPRKPKGV